jgi:hypothetical protein
MVNIPFSFIFLADFLQDGSIYEIINIDSFHSAPHKDKGKGYIYHIKFRKKDRTCIEDIIIDSSGLEVDEIQLYWYPNYGFANGLSIFGCPEKKIEAFNTLDKAFEVYIRRRKLESIYDNTRSN